jgi:hypothetical protein
MNEKVVDKLMGTYEKNARVGLRKSFLMRILLFILTLLPVVAQGQITIDKAGDGWDLKVDSAIILIKQTDTNYYKLLVEYCQRVEFWNGPFSTNEWKNNSGTILVSVKDVKLNSLNNLAAVLVHESCHLVFRKGEYITSEENEERECYLYEMGFILQLPNLESWLFEHTLQMSK